MFVISVLCCFGSMKETLSQNLFGGLSNLHGFVTNPQAFREGMSALFFIFVLLIKNNTDENAVTHIVDTGDRENDVARRGKNKDFAS